MKHDVLDVLMYIFERFQDQEYLALDEANHLSSELNEVGFSDGDIDSALDWIDGLVELREMANSSEDTGKKAYSTRVYNDEEKAVLNSGARGFLYYLEGQGVLDGITREAVIERVVALGVEQVDIEQLKWVTMMVLFNLPGQESACAWFENIDDVVH